MSTATDTHGTHEAHDSHSRPDSDYVKIALFLAVLTGIEVAISYIDIGPFFLPLLFILMAVKFVTVALFFMHLKFDSKWFNMAFWTGLGLAISVYLVAMLTFRFFG